MFQANWNGHKWHVCSSRHFNQGEIVTGHLLKVFFINFNVRGKSIWLNHWMQVCIYKHKNTKHFLVFFFFLFPSFVCSKSLIYIILCDKMCHVWALRKGALQFLSLQYMCVHISELWWLNRFFVQIQEECLWKMTKMMHQVWMHAKIYLISSGLMHVPLFSFLFCSYRWRAYDLTTGNASSKLSDNPKFDFSYKSIRWIFSCSPQIWDQLELALWN